MNMAIYRIGKCSWKRLGMLGFAFFLVKGLLWLTVPLVMYLLGIKG